MTVKPLYLLLAAALLFVGGFVFGCRSEQTRAEQRAAQIVAKTDTLLRTVRDTQVVYRDRLKSDTVRLTSFVTRYKTLEGRIDTLFLPLGEKAVATRDTVRSWFLVADSTISACHSAVHDCSELVRLDSVQIAGLEREKQALAKAVKSRAVLPWFVAGAVAFGLAQHVLVK